MRQEERNNRKQGERFPGEPLLSVYEIRRTVCFSLALILCAAVLWGGLRLLITGRKSRCGLIVSEVITKNTSAFCDENGDFPDLIELCNPTDKPVELGGMTLTDGPASHVYVFEPESLLPGEVKLVCCSSSFPFSLRRDGGETLTLRDAMGRLVSALELPALSGNQAYSWNGETYEVTGVISPGFPNTEDGVAAYLASRVREDAPLVISEAVTGNVTLTGTGEQLVEVENRSSSPVLLSDYWISDGTEDLFRFRLPGETLEPGGHRVLTFGTVGADAVFGFKDTEFVTLSDSCGRICSVVPAAIGDDRSASLLEDGGYEITSAVTVGYPNTAQGRKQYLEACPLPAVIINEVVSDNGSTLSGRDGTQYDLIELYNRSAEAVDLTGYSLSDSSDDPEKAPLSGVIEAGGYKVILASRKEGEPPKGYEAVLLGVSKEGETLFLSRDGKPVHCLQIPELGRNCAYGYASSGEAGLLSEMTPGKANGRLIFPCEAPSASLPGGVYEDAGVLTVELSGEGTIYYTLDGSTPTERSKCYDGSLSFTATTVLRARCYRPGCEPSPVLTETYLVNEGHTLDVLCLTSDPDGLFSEENGIYATGSGASSVSPYYGANFWKGWERQAHVALYAEDGGFSSDCGVRMFGGFSKAFSQKSLAVFFRAKYGAGDLAYPLFGEEGLDSYESFVIRASGQDVFQAHMRDALTTALFEDLVGTAFVQKYRPVVLYINGRYWGVYYIREKINEHYIAGRCNVDADTVDIAFQTGFGHSDWLALMKWINSHDLSDPENFAYVEERINLDSYRDYLIAEIYSGNFDIGNVRYFSAPGYDDGRWTWILYDVDWSMYFLHADSVADLMGNSIVYSSDLIHALLKNEEFRDSFFTEFARQLKEVWNGENINRYIDAFCGFLGPEMERECKRWNWSLRTWESEVDWMRQFAAERPAFLYDCIKNYFQLSDDAMQAYGFEK